MLTTRELLAAAKGAQGIPSNYRLARVLDVPETTVQRWNTGRNLPDDAMCLRLAALAGLDPAQVVASIRAEREAQGPLHEFWSELAKRLQGATAAVLAAILALFVGGGPDAGAQAAQVQKLSDAGSTREGMYIMSNVWRRLRAGFGHGFRRLAAHWRAFILRMTDTACNGADR